MSQCTGILVFPGPTPCNNQYGGAYGSFYYNALPVAYETECAVGIYSGAPPYYPTQAYLDGLCPGSQRAVETYTVNFVDCPIIGGFQSAKYEYFCADPADPSVVDCRDGVGRLWGIGTAIAHGLYAPNPNGNLYPDDTPCTNTLCVGPCTFEINTGFFGGYFEWVCAEARQCDGFGGASLDHYTNSNLCCPTCYDAFGSCWCDETETCVPCDNAGECANELETTWDPATCEETHTEPPTCAPGLTWDWCECECSAGGNCPDKKGEQPWGEHDVFDEYGVAYRVSRRIRFKGWPYSIPEGSAAVNGVVTVDYRTPTVEDRYPCWTVETRRNRYWCAFERNATSTYLAYSDDDGASWTVESAAVLSATRPHTRVHPNGLHIVAGYYSGTIIAKRREPGDTAFGTQFTFKDDAGANLAAQEDVFTLSPAHDVAQRWVLALRQAGVVRIYQSWDDCETWKEIT